MSKQWKRIFEVAFTSLLNIAISLYYRYYRCQLPFQLVFYQQHATTLAVVCWATSLFLCCLFSFLLFEGQFFPNVKRYNVVFVKGKDESLLYFFEQAHVGISPVAGVIM